MKALLSHGADLKARENWYGETALMWAAAENHVDAIKVLVEHGADVNERSRLLDVPRRRNGQSILPLGNWTPLMYAARQGCARSGQDAGRARRRPEPDRPRWRDGTRPRDHQRELRRGRGARREGRRSRTSPTRKRRWRRSMPPSTWIASRLVTDGRTRSRPASWAPSI